MLCTRTSRLEYDMTLARAQGTTVDELRVRCRVEDVFGAADLPVRYAQDKWRDEYKGLDESSSSESSDSDDDKGTGKKNSLIGNVTCVRAYLWRLCLHASLALRRAVCDRRTGRRAEPACLAGYRETVHGGKAEGEG